MSFNPRPETKGRPVLKQFSDYGIQPERRATTLAEKEKFYIEYWKIGATEVISDHFHIVPSSLEFFLNRLVSTYKYIVVYVQRSRDEKVLLNRRGKSYTIDLPGAP